MGCLTAGFQVVHVGSVSGERPFVYDGVFDSDSSQAEVYAKIGRPALCDVLKGMHGCILAYGQTGSGKTYTLLQTGDGTDTDEVGLVPRFISELYVNIATDFDRVYAVSYTHLTLPTILLV
eukprot:8216110-Pyramimonas_sp.AAC.1